MSHGRLAGAVPNGDENHGGVVQATSRVGQLDQTFRRSLWIPLPPDDVKDRRRLHAACQAIGAQEQHVRSEEHTSELQSRLHLVCRLLLEKKKRYSCSATGGTHAVIVTAAVHSNATVPSTC